MKSKKNPPIEEISADEVEVLDAGGQSSETITRISADDSTGLNFSGENPFGKMMEMMEEWKKLRFFGPTALLLSLFSINFEPFYLAPIAIALALLDFWKGSRLTRKVSIFAIILSILALLNAWT